MKIQRARDPQNLTSFEQTHLPLILFPKFVKRGERFEVVVKVGKVDHPMTNEHYIICVRLLYIGDKVVECKKLRLPGPSEAKFNISLEKDSVIKAQVECNLHGAWESEEKVVLYRGNEE